MIRTRALLVSIVFLAAWPGQAGQQKQKPASPAQSKQQESGAVSQASAEEDIQVGTFYLHKGDADAAISRFKDAIRQQPKLAKPHILLAEAYEKKDDKIGAADAYRDYLEAFPNAPDKKKIEKKIEKLTSH